MDNSKQSFDSLLDQLTSSQLDLDPDSPVCVELRVCVKKVPCEYAANRILSKLNSPDEKVVLYALKILERCTVFCGEAFLQNVLTEHFMQEFHQLITMTNNPKIKDEFLKLIQIWVMANREKPIIFRTLQNIVIKLRSDGYEFSLLSEDDNIFLTDRIPRLSDINDCYHCQKELTEAKQRCPICAQIFCLECLSKTSVMPGCQTVRKVCDECHKDLNKQDEDELKEEKEKELIRRNERRKEIQIYLQLVAGFIIVLLSIYCFLLQSTSNQPDFKGLLQNMTNNVFGQHIAVETISKALKSHLNKKQPEKPLVLFFQGETGTGKTYLAKMIAYHLYEIGYGRDYSHFFQNFHLQHQQNLNSWIEGNVTKFPRSLFIFDDIDDIKGIKSVHLQYSREAIFIFTSVAGSSHIRDITLHHWMSRKDIGVEDFSLGSLDEEIEEKILIEWGAEYYFIPFLPLEKEHVKLCIRNELKRKNIHPFRSLIDKIANGLEYSQHSSQLYSLNGCKRIEDVVSLEIDV